MILFVLLFRETPESRLFSQSRIWFRYPGLENRRQRRARSIRRFLQAPVVPLLTLPFNLRSQMIPHHENAVNTAKTLLKTGNLLCPDLTDQSNPDCQLEGILLAIIAGQNYQIQLMRSFLSNRQYPQDDNCDVFVRTMDDPAEALAKITLDSAASPGILGRTTALLVLAVVWSFTLW